MKSDTPSCDALKMVFVAAEFQVRAPHDRLLKVSLLVYTTTLWCLDSNKSIDLKQIILHNLGC